MLGPFAPDVNMSGASDSLFSRGSVPRWLLREVHLVVLKLADVVGRCLEQSVRHVTQRAGRCELGTDLRYVGVARTAPGAAVAIERRAARRRQDGVGLGDDTIGLQIVGVEQADGHVPGVSHGGAPLGLACRGHRCAHRGNAPVIRQTDGCKVAPKPDDGATRGIAECVAATLTRSGQRVEVRSVEDASALDGFATFVIGSAVYMGHWLKPAASFVASHRELLTAHPVWLFSSGPLGTERTDPTGKDLGEASEPKETAELLAAIHPREHRGFFGALDPRALTLPERTLRQLPAGRAIMPAGDFRDSAEIELWAHDIAKQLTTGAGPASVR